MPTAARWLGPSFLALSTLLTAGCAAVDKYADRAVSYNLEAEQAQARQILLNAVRASLRRPMQFSIVKDVQGQSAVKGDATLSLPFGHGPATKSNLMLQGEASAGVASFDSPILDTQEFYSGITEPVAASFINLLLREGYPKSLVFYLLVGSIEFDRSNGTRMVFRNYVADDSEFDAFQVVLNYLIQSGMDTEEVASGTAIGPVLTSAEAAKNAVDAAKAGLDLKKQGRGYQLEKPPSGYRLCFTPPPGYEERLVASAICGAGGSHSSAFAKLSVAAPLQSLDEIMQRLRQIPYRPYRTLIARSENHKLTLNIRSPEAVLYYLGEIVRRHLSPEYGKSPRIIKIKIGPANEPMPDGICQLGDNNPAPQNHQNSRYDCESVFLVDKGSGRSYATVDYDGATYWLHDERGLGSEAGISLSVLDLMKMLLALNASAKQLPTASALSVVLSP